MSVEETVNSYISKIHYHNHLMENIDVEMYFHISYDDNALTKIENLAKEVAKLEQFIPSDILKTAPKLTVWGEEHYEKLDPDLAKAMKQMIAQEEKIRDFVHMYHYLDTHKKNYNVGIVLVTMVKNWNKICTNAVKKGFPFKKEKYKELELLIRGMQKEKPTKKQLNDVKGFEALQKKYPQFDFDRKELSQAEKDLKDQNMEVNVVGQANIKV